MIKKEKSDIIIYENKIASNFEAVDRCVNDILQKMKTFDPLKDEELLFKTSFIDLFYSKIDLNRFQILKPNIPIDLARQDLLNDML